MIGRSRRQAPRPAFYGPCPYGVRMTDRWSTDTLARVDVARRRIEELRHVVAPLFPREVPSNGAHGDWPITGWALLARMNGIADAILALIPERRAVEAAVLARTLLESMITFAWIGIDPPDNAPAWLRWDRRQRIKADNDVISSGAPALLDPQTRRLRADHRRRPGDAGRPRTASHPGRPPLGTAPGGRR